MAPIYCLIFIAIMSAFAEYIAWFCVILVQLGLIGGAVACYMYRQSLKDANVTETARLLDEGKDITMMGENF